MSYQLFDSYGVEVENGGWARYVVEMDIDGDALNGEDLECEKRVRWTGDDNPFFANCLFIDCQLGIIDPLTGEKRFYDI